MILDQFSLKGKTALVTGSSRGLGAGIAMALADAGANIAIHGSTAVPESTQKMLESIGANQFAVVGDVSDAAACERIVDETYQHFGAIDILVNNAGTIRRAAAIEHSDEYWQTVIDTNLSSVFRLMKHAGKHMLTQGYGKIINIASMLTRMRRPKGEWVN